MQYELWARSRETKIYEFQDSFTNKNERDYRIDTVDTDLYDEALVLITDYNKEPKLDLYIDLNNKPKRKGEVNYEIDREYNDKLERRSR